MYKFADVSTLFGVVQSIKLYSDMPSKINWCEAETSSRQRAVDIGLFGPRNDMVLQLSKISSHLWDKAYWVSVAVPVQELLVISCHRCCSQQNPSLWTCDKTTSSDSTEVHTAALVNIQVSGSLHRVYWKIRGWVKWKPQICNKKSKFRAIIL